MQDDRHGEFLHADTPSAGIRYTTGSTYSKNFAPLAHRETGSTPRILMRRRMAVAAHTRTAPSRADCRLPLIQPRGHESHQILELRHILRAIGRRIDAELPGIPALHHREEQPPVRLANLEARHLADAEIE